ncbi:isochorismatase family protein [Halioglobus maricola]|uniref:Isochorismatase family protein n=1 Tax=Halioglobus maricola TaxID=2601894 RepID=A0A5P9NL55_9GAMM|nr:isochorismatase family protein [Halioglobus maricola]QFU76482.1 isochorismatase family protein [Halioglobus maricola]
MDLDRESLGLGVKPALLLVDMIEGFTNPECPLGCDCPEVVAANADVLEAFRAAKMPIFYTTVVFHGDEQARVFRERVPALNVLTPQSNWVKVDERLAMREGEVLVEKQWASAFRGTDIDEQLRAQGVDSLVVTGLTTSGCVRATVVDGLQYDYRVVVAKEAVGDRNAEAHEANLFDMHAKYADVWPVADVLADIRMRKSL